MAPYNPQEVEKEILQFWKDSDIYRIAKERNNGRKSFYFLDGPPYTSGVIHLGHAWNKSLKDMVLRYKRMQGFDVWDRAGYDMHGLPTAHKVEEKFGIRKKDEIPKFGFARFIEECRNLALQNLELMNRDFARLGVWMDFGNSYKTIDNSFMEGEWWLIKRAHENKRLYEGLRTMHWCAKCATSLAKHELEYENVTENSIFVKFRVKDRENEYLIIWTTTPWTLAFNLGVMVNPELEYVRAKVDDEVWIVSKALASVFISGVANRKFHIIEEFHGDRLHGLRYEHPWESDIEDFKHIKSEKKHTVVLSTEYVDTSAGSGLVHMAPGCGPEDFEVGHREGLPPFNNIDEFGMFPISMGRFSGIYAKKDDAKFVEALGSSLIATSEVEHEYAHCWRCKSPVVFRTTKQWFFRIEDMKERMRELNKSVKWQPEWSGSRWFDSWINNLRDNGITRQREWGTPLPIWRCPHCNDFDVIGSIAELKQKADNVPADLHRPYIDEVKLKCKCGSEKTRIPDILDVWIDSGTASWSCLGFPQSREKFDMMFPADFILEGKDQIRGWFNLLTVASMVALNANSYKSVYMHGFVQDAEGRKMSKSLGNVISPYEVIDKFGADTLRYYMIGGALPGLDINYNFNDMKVKNKNLNVLWNIHNFLIELCKNSKIDPSKPIENPSIEEKYILSKLHSTIKEVTKMYNEYLLNEIPNKVEELYLELSRTYLQLTREKAAGREKHLVASVAYRVLMDSITLLAPVIPFITEKMYQNLKAELSLEEESVHLLWWPKHDDALIDAKLEEDMAIASQAIQAILSGREKIGMGVRWPLQSATVVTGDNKVRAAVHHLEKIVKLQANIKSLNIESSMHGVRALVKSDFKTLGPEFGASAPKIIAKLSTESPDAVLGHIGRSGKFTLMVEGKEIAVRKEHIIVAREVPKNLQEVEMRNAFIYLNRDVTEELEAEGYSRELMRHIQSARKDAGFEKTDKIKLLIVCDSGLGSMINPWLKNIQEKVGANTLKVASSPSVKFDHNVKFAIKGRAFEIFFSRV
ncbi:isoleucine--tRNA ligase [Candidatus Woesearchaeota archaeon]|nr:isoleucine--tRNA ligase [Candidatus Woesearchaeota archaeon]